MPPPRLVVEVVSPGKTNIDRDYRYKRSQYQARGIAEYWIVDPITQRVTVLTLWWKGSMRKRFLRALRYQFTAAAGTRQVQGR
jgi:Uma2 family endonuclease